MVSGAGQASLAAFCLDWVPGLSRAPLVADGPGVDPDDMPVQRLGDTAPDGGGDDDLLVAGGDGRWALTAVGIQLANTSSRISTGRRRGLGAAAWRMPAARQRDRPDSPCGRTFTGRSLMRRRVAVWAHQGQSALELLASPAWREPGELVGDLSVGVVGLRVALFRSPPARNPLQPRAVVGAGDGCVGVGHRTCRWMPGGCAHG